VSQGTQRTILYVVGARPNFMKIAPILRAADREPGWNNVLVHTGQHYDEGMSSAFFRDLGIRDPDESLGVGSGSHATQTARVMVEMERVVLERRPDLVVVVGDVNSTLAAALAAAKQQVKVAHVEAGLRSRDRSMPEELNRLLTDQLSELCLTPSRDGDANLLQEGIAPERIFFVGNIMIDSLMTAIDEARALSLIDDQGLQRGAFVMATFHRPSNVDDREQLEEILAALRTIADRMPVVFPMHPRTADRIKTFGLDTGKIRILEPVGYLQSLHLQDGSAAVVTDSGGLQEETTILGVPCITLRSTTERPVTVTEGTNELTPVRTKALILAAFERALAKGRTPRRPEGWDGKAAERIVSVFRQALRSPKGVGESKA
jgi:UDP-N-acetylglucosamine 2-epimerase (non-hydrolysing)